jgi:hypothetical protein
MNHLQVNGPKKTTTLKRTGTLLSNVSGSDIDEDKVISEALTTPYEKVMRILIAVKKHLESTKCPLDMISDLAYVIKRIQSHKLYTYESDQTIELEKLSKNSHEVRSFLEFLNNYSENKEFRKRNKKDSKVSKTTRARDKVIQISQKKNSWQRFKTNQHNQGNPNQTQFQDLDKDFYRKLSMMPNNNSCSSSKFNKLKLDDDDDDVIPLSPIQKKATENLMSFNLMIPPSNDSNKIVDEEFGIDDRKINFVPNPFSGVKLGIKDYLEGPPYNMEKILDFDFDLFDFEDAIGRGNVLPVAAKYIVENFDLVKTINSKFLDKFLVEVRDAYRFDVPYHNEMHGIDVCQTVSIYLSNSEVAEFANFRDLDILALVISSLIHDLGHPGRNNNFHTNALTEIALTYNDKSVLENYHVSEAFRIIQKPECNIFIDLPSYDFKHVRKRMIEAVISTDMMFHSRVQSLVKNRLEINNVKDGINVERIINPTSQTLFEDQQEIINFLIHSADISHNSKAFKISYKWTYLLMDEFWKQGDYEKSLGLPISFLCDRQTADVPKSQIGFIKGIIIPTFDILCDLMPTMIYYKDWVMDNIEEWGKIIEENEEKNR